MVQEIFKHVLPDVPNTLKNKLTIKDTIKKII